MLEKDDRRKQNMSSNKMNNLTEKRIEFDVNSKLDESFFDESLDERMKILTKVLLIKVFSERDLCFASRI